jgi:hypothetical protein
MEAASCGHVGECTYTCVRVCVHQVCNNCVNGDSLWLCSYG